MVSRKTVRWPKLTIGEVSQLNSKTVATIYPLDHLEPKDLVYGGWSHGGVLVVNDALTSHILAGIAGRVILDTQSAESVVELVRIDSIGHRGRPLADGFPCRYVQDGESWQGMPVGMLQARAILKSRRACWGVVWCRSWLGRIGCRRLHKGGNLACRQKKATVQLDDAQP